MGVERRNFLKKEEQKARFSLLFHRDSALYFSRIVEKYLNILFMLLFISCLQCDCDSCDSKNAKTPVVCAYTRAREPFIDIFRIENSPFPMNTFRLLIAISSPSSKTTRRFV